MLEEDVVDVKLGGVDTVYGYATNANHFSFTYRFS